MSGTATFSRR
jgi:hypothetical protein